MHKIMFSQKLNFKNRPNKMGCREYKISNVSPYLSIMSILPHSLVYSVKLMENFILFYLKKKKKRCLDLHVNDLDNV